MIYKCKKCGRTPKTTSEHSYRVATYKVYCDCGEETISNSSMWSAKKDWNKINKKGE